LGLKIQTSSKPAAEQRNGPENACGLIWSDRTNYKSTTEIGEQMAAMEIFKANLGHTVEGPVAEKTGGTSKGNSETGDESGGNNAAEKNIRTRAISTGDEPGAGVVAALADLMPVGAAAPTFVFSQLSPVGVGLLCQGQCLDMTSQFDGHSLHQNWVQ
jgi:mannan endo-1,6-alpha-mannosidase